jgi:hypothetical protein
MYDSLLSERIYLCQNIPPGRTTSLDYLKEGKKQALQGCVFLGQSERTVQQAFRSYDNLCVIILTP